MLTEKDFANIEKQAVQIYQNLELQIIEEIATRIANFGYANTVVINNLKIAEEMGFLYEDIVKLVAEYNNTTLEEVNKIFYEAGEKSLSFDDKIYKEAGLNPIPLKQSESIKQIMNAAIIRTTGNLQNLCMTTATTSQTQFINAINNAYLYTSTGVKSYTSAILDEIKNISKQGAVIEYPSGARRSLESAIRTNIITSVNQNCGKLQEMRADEMDCDLMELTAHSGARPEHATWQGKIVSRSGQRGYLSLRDIGYGTATGFKGVNCRHDWYPYYKGSSRTYTEKQLKEWQNETVTYNGQKISKYEATQIQRKLERQIRQDKKEIAGLQGILTSNNKDDKLIEDTKMQILNKQNKLKNDNTLLNDFVEQTNSRKDYTRLYVGKNKIVAKLGNSNNNSIGGSGKGTFIEKVGKKELPQKLKEYEDQIRDMKTEYGVVIDKNGNLYAYIGAKTNLDITDRKLDNTIITHNHPEIGAFGKDDFELLKANPKIKELRAVDSKYTYSLKLLKPIDISYNEIYIEGAQTAFETGDDIQHCAMKKLKEKGYVKYERKRKR